VARLMLARVEDKAGNRKAVIEAYRSVVASDPQNASANNNLAYQLALDDPREALHFAQRAVELAPTDAAALDTLGWVHYRMGEYTTAVDYFKNALAKRSSPALEFHLAMCYIKAGDPDRGRTMLADALRRDPNLYQTQTGW
jgi:Tfp pilus assembly protein PilF